MKPRWGLLVISLSLIAGFLVLGAVFLGVGIGLGRTAFSQSISGTSPERLKIQISESLTDLGLATKSDVDAVTKPLRADLDDLKAATGKEAEKVTTLDSRVQALESAQQAAAEQDSNPAPAPPESSSETKPPAPSQDDAANMQEECMRNIMYAAILAAGCAVTSTAHAGDHTHKCDVPGAKYIQEVGGCVLVLTGDAQVANDPKTGNKIPVRMDYDPKCDGKPHGFEYQIEVVNPNDGAHGVQTRICD